MLWRQPPSLSSDDVLHFARALTRFSVLDFSPHFPGYPVFVALGRLTRQLVPDPVEALQATTIAVAFVLPVAAAWVAWAVSRASWAALSAFALTLACPLLPVLALSGLSDGTGLLFFLGFLAVVPVTLSERGDCRALWAVAAGVVLGLAFWARPSFGPMLAVAYLVVVFSRPRLGATVLAGAALVSVPVLAVVLAAEGVGYFQEGLRFLKGHTLVWGNTALAGRKPGNGWLSVLSAHPTLAALLAVFVAGAVVALVPVTGSQAPQARLSVGSELASRAVAAAFATALIWTLLMQNPENLRHLASVLILGGLLAATLPNGRYLKVAAVVVALLLEAWLVVTTWDLDPPRPSALAAVAQTLDRDPGAVVVTDDGVGLLRAEADRLRVYDLAFPAAADAGLASAQGRAFRLVRMPLAGCNPAMVSAGRMPGEASRYLYRLTGADVTPACAKPP